MVPVVVLVEEIVLGERYVVVMTFEVNEGWTCVFSFPDKISAVPPVHVSIDVPVEQAFALRYITDVTNEPTLYAFGRDAVHTADPP